MSELEHKNIMETEKSIIILKKLGKSDFLLEELQYFFYPPRKHKLTLVLMIHFGESEKLEIKIKTTGQRSRKRKPLDQVLVEADF